MGSGPRRRAALLALGLAASAGVAVLTTPQHPAATPAPTVAVGAAATTQALPAAALPAASPAALPAVASPAALPAVAPAAPAASPAAVPAALPAATAPAPAASPAPAAAPAVAAGPGAIGPGTVTETSGAGLCTAGFVFTAGGKTYLGQAAHCAGTGDEDEIDGCTSATAPLGTPVLVHGRGRAVTGKLAWSSWNTMQHRHERNADTCAYNDFALVELPKGAASSAGAAVPFFGGPTGVHPGALATGAQVYGLANPPGARGVRTVAPRAGTVSDEVGGGWGHEVSTLRKGVAGESGGPLLDASGRALGILSSLTTTDGRTSIEYSDLAKAVAYAQRTDGPAGLTLARGSGFTTTPRGVDPRTLATPSAGPALR
ncbi:serine protease [Pseudonocardia phyllosphaerae]|uniref:serine protease n=1 Tax=Pseudonocardia phyllosphaerae TaxID=3390502 RepID=UPI00397A87E1